MWETLWQSTIFCKERYSVSLHDLALLVIVILNQLNIKKKSTKTILKKIIRKKNSCGKTLYQSTVFCEENYSAFPTWFSFIVIVILNQINIKKLKSIKIILKKIIKKNHVGKPYSNPQCFKEKKLQS